MRQRTVVEKCPSLTELEAWTPAIRAHVAACPRCRVERKLLGIAGSSPPPPDDKDSGPFVHERYQLGALLGIGGMGEVWRAFDRELRRWVALKVFAGSAQARDLERRFVAEGQITAQLRHPAIVHIHDAGRTADGRFFYTMEEVVGTTLRELLPPANSAAVRRCVEILGHVCDAVSHAHERRVVHRDLKPSNIMVGELSEVRVLDWGLAVARGGSGGPVQTIRSDGHTVDGQMGGTAWYMPPEQASRGLAATDSRA